MHSSAINQRYATLEDIFIQYVSPILYQEIPGLNEILYLNNPDKDRYITKAELEKGIKFYYNTKSNQGLIITKFKDAYNTTKDSFLKDIINATQTFYNIRSGVSVDGSSVIYKLYTTSINAIKYSNTLIEKFKINFLNYIRYIIKNIIAKYKFFIPYYNILCANDFILESTKISIRNSHNILLSFKKISNVSEVIEQAIQNIEFLTVQAVAQILMDCVITPNIDVIYKTFTLTGYLIDDVSQQHTDNSLFRLCDVLRDNVFKLVLLPNYNNPVYEYNDYAKFIIDGANTLHYFPKTPCKLSVVSKNADNVNIPYRLINLSITTASNNGTLGVNQKTQEMINQFLSDNSNISINSTIGNNSNVSSDNNSSTGSSTGGTSSKVKSKAIAPETNIESQYSTNSAISILQRYEGTDVIINRNDYNTQDELLTKSNNDYKDFNNKTEDTLTQNNRNTNNESTIIGSTTSNQNKTFTLSDQFKQYQSNQFGTTLYDNTAKVNLMDIVENFDLNKLQYSDSNALMSEIGVGLVPYKNEHYYMHTYLAANNDIDPDCFPIVCPVFTSPNYSISKRMASFTLQQSGSSKQHTIVITQYGTPLYVNISLLHTPNICICPSDFSITQNYFNSILTKDDVYTNDTNNTKLNINNVDAKTDILFQNNLSITDSINTLENSFIYNSKTHYSTANNGLYETNILTNIKYNGTYSFIPSELKYIHIHLNYITLPDDDYSMEEDDTKKILTKTENENNELTYSLDMDKYDMYYSDKNTGSQMIVDYLQPGTATYSKTFSVVNNPFSKINVQYNTTTKQYTATTSEFQQFFNTYITATNSMYIYKLPFAFGTNNISVIVTTTDLVKDYILRYWKKDPSTNTFTTTV